jgi:hypothetical protein
MVGGWRPDDAEALKEALESIESEMDRRAGT